jgi:hypothetical protein
MRRSPDHPPAPDVHAPPAFPATGIGAKSVVAQSIDGVAEVVAACRDAATGARLWAAAETIRRTTRSALLDADRRRVDRAARASTTEDGWWAAWAAGEALSVEAAIDLALQLAAPGGAHAREPASAAV